MNPHVASWIRDMRGPDVRVVDLTGKEHFQAGANGNVSVALCCPWCDGQCWLHFAADGEGRFICKPCGAVGSAEHGEYFGRRQIELTLECQSDDAQGGVN